MVLSLDFTQFFIHHIYSYEKYFTEQCAASFLQVIKCDLLIKLCPAGLFAREKWVRVFLGTVIPGDLVLLHSQD